MTTIRGYLNRHPVLHPAVFLMGMAIDPILLPPPSLALSAAKPVQRFDLTWINSENGPVAICFRKGEVLLEMSCG